MNLLLDTHIALWALSNDPRLSAKARKMLLDPGNTFYVSAVSVWEVLLKHSKNPINLEISATEFSQYCQAAGFHTLALTDEHIWTVETLQRSADAKAHNDPFDRLLLAQAKAEHYFFLTHDSLIPGYEESCVINV